MGLNFLLDRGDLITQRLWNVSPEFISEIFVESPRVAVAACHNKLAFSLIVCRVRHTTQYAQLSPRRCDGLWDD